MDVFLVKAVKQTTGLTTNGSTSLMSNLLCSLMNMDHQQIEKLQQSLCGRYRVFPPPSTDTPVLLWCSFLSFFLSFYIYEKMLSS